MTGQYSHVIQHAHSMAFKLSHIKWNNLIKINKGNCMPKVLLDHKN